MQRRFIQRGTAYATFFDDNYVAAALGCETEQAEHCLSKIVGQDTASLRRVLGQKSLRFLGRAKKIARADLFEAVQAAAIELLKDAKSPYQELAEVIWSERFENSLRLQHRDESVDVGDHLAAKTFFTELRKRPQLRERLWPKPRNG